MTGSTVTALDDILALGLKGEILIEGRYAVDTRLTYVKLLCDVGECLSGQVVIMLLNCLKNGDYGSRR